MARFSYGEVARRDVIRRSNLGVVLRHIRAAGPCGRVRLAEELGLPKATVSTLVGELIALGLLAEGGPASVGAVGRPSPVVRIAAAPYLGVGVEIVPGGARAVAVDLRGETVLDRSVAVVPGGPTAMLDAVAGLVSSTLDAGTVLGVTIAAPGQIDRETGVLAYSAVLGWSDVDLAGGLAARLPPASPPVRADNDARLGALAERGSDLVYLTGGMGIGAGVVVGGDVLRGALGFAGEIGHLPLGPADRLCPCGRSGCLELAVGLPAFLDLATRPDDPAHRLGIEDRMAALGARARAGDARVLAAVAEVGRVLGLGVSMLVDVLSPRAVVLGGYFGTVAPWLLPVVEEVLAQRAIAGQVVGLEVRASAAGFAGPVLGAAQDALEPLFVDPAGMLSAG